MTVVRHKLGYIIVPITQNMIKHAIPMAEKIGNLHNSILNGKGNIIGALGELAFLEAFPDAKWVGNYDYDIIYDGTKVECKTKHRKYPHDYKRIPESKWDASVDADNISQKADIYVFITIYSKKGEYIEAYIHGYYDKYQYIKDATFLPAGTVDPSNYYKVLKDCYNLIHTKLNRFYYE